MREAYLLDLELNVVNSARLDGLLRLGNNGLDENDRFVVKTLNPANHLLRDDLGLDKNKTLHGVVLLTEDDENHLGACREIGCEKKKGKKGKRGENHAP
jgi:hypothetical protein